MTNPTSPRPSARLLLCLLLALPAATIAQTMPPGTEKAMPADGALILPGDKKTSRDQSASPATTGTAKGSRTGPISATGARRFQQELAECQALDQDSRQSCVDGMWASRAEGHYRD